MANSDVPIEISQNQIQIDAYFAAKEKNEAYPSAQWKGRLIFVAGKVQYKSAISIFDRFGKNKFVSLKKLASIVRAQDDNNVDPRLIKLFKHYNESKVQHPKDQIDDETMKTLETRAVLNIMQKITDGVEIPPGILEKSIQSFSTDNNQFLLRTILQTKSSLSQIVVARVMAAIPPEQKLVTDADRISAIKTYDQKLTTILQHDRLTPAQRDECLACLAIMWKICPETYAGELKGITAPILERLLGDGVFVHTGNQADILMIVKKYGPLSTKPETNALLYSQLKQSLNLQYKQAMKTGNIEQAFQLMNGLPKELIATMTEGTKIKDWLTQRDKNTKKTLSELVFAAGSWPIKTHFLETLQPKDLTIAQLRFLLNQDRQNQDPVKYPPDFSAALRKHIMHLIKKTSNDEDMRFLFGLLPGDSIEANDKESAKLATKYCLKAFNKTPPDYETAICFLEPLPKTLRDPLLYALREQKNQASDSLAQLIQLAHIRKNGDLLEGLIWCIFNRAQFWNVFATLQQLEIANDHKKAIQKAFVPLSWSSDPSDPPGTTESEKRLLALIEFADPAWLRSAAVMWHTMESDKTLLARVKKVLNDAKTNAQDTFNQVMKELRTPNSFDMMSYARRNAGEDSRDQISFDSFSASMLNKFIGIIEANNSIDTLDKLFEGIPLEIFVYLYLNEHQNSSKRSGPPAPGPIYNYISKSKYRDMFVVLLPEKYNRAFLDYHY